MKKLKLIVSDFHLGKGRYLPSRAINKLEDFNYDTKFKEFIEFHTTNEYQDAHVELVMNGDILNLIQLDYHGHYTVIITESVSVTKLKSVIDGHPLFFKTLKDFLQNPNHILTYVVGNHDQEMMWAGCRRMFEEAVGREVNWKNTHYQIDGIHIEHGHQFETVNRVDPTRAFITENLPEPILNLPWGTLFTVQFIIKLKQLRPAIDKVRPFHLMIRWSLIHDTWMALYQGLQFLLYFITTQFSKNRFRQTNLNLTFGMLFNSRVFPDLSEFAKKILRTPEIHTVIFGHTHVYKQIQFGDEKQYINTGTWCDIISLELETFARRSRLTYVRVEYEEDKPRALLRHWIGRIPLEEDALMAA